MLLAVLTIWRAFGSPLWGEIPEALMGQSLLLDFLRGSEKTAFCGVDTGGIPEWLIVEYVPLQVVTLKRKSPDLLWTCLEGNGILGSAFR